MSLVCAWHTFKSQLKHANTLSSTTHSHKCHTHVKIAYINLQLVASSIIINPDPSAACAHHTRPNISHASRTHLISLPSRCHLISSRCHRAVDPLGPPSQRITPYRYPSFLKRPKPGRHSPAPPRTRAPPAPSDDLYGRPWLWLRVPLSVYLLSACARIFGQPRCDRAQARTAWCSGRSPCS